MGSGHFVQKCRRQPAFVLWYFGRRFPLTQPQVPIQAVLISFSFLSGHSLLPVQSFAAFECRHAWVGLSGLDHACLARVHVYSCALTGRFMNIAPPTLHQQYNSCIGSVYRTTFIDARQKHQLFVSAVPQISNSSQGPSNPVHMAQILVCQVLKGAVLVATSSSSP